MARGDTWRDICKRVIGKVILENPNADYKTFKKLLREAYPFGERARFPYAVWCDQQKRTLKQLYPNRKGKMLEMPTEGLFAPEILIHNGNLSADEIAEIKSHVGDVERYYLDHNVIPRK